MVEPYTESRAPITSPWAGALLVWLTAYALLAERVFISRGPGEAVPVLGIGTVLLGTVLFISSGKIRRYVLERLTQTPWLLAFLSIWTVHGLAGPIVGYPVHTVFTALVPITILVLCCMGLLLASGEMPRGLVFFALLLIGSVQAIAGLMQALWYTGIFATAPQRWLYLWDTRVSVEYGVEQIAGRSVGLYTNPNTYSLIGGTLLVFALFLPLRVRGRVALGIPAATIVLLGASRSVTLAVALIVVSWAITRLRALDRRALPGAVAGVGVIVVLATVMYWVVGSTVYLRSISRWSTVPELLAIGSAADANVAGRFEAWSRIISYWSQSPFGTFGPPQMAVSTFTDNDYIALLLQGGLLLLGTYAGVLASSYVNRHRSPLASTVAPLIALIAVTGLTQTSIIAVPALAFFWPVIGTTLSPRPDEQPAVGPPRRALVRRRAAMSRQRAFAIIGGSFVVVLGLASFLRFTGSTIEFIRELEPDHTRPRDSVEATATLPGWRVDARDDGLGMYYVDLPAPDSPGRMDDLSVGSVSPAEEQSLSEVWEAPAVTVRGTEWAAPIGVAVAGLRDYTRFVATEEPGFADSARSAAEWLLDEQRPDGSWRYRYGFFDLSPGWASANTQSLGISLLTRMYEESGEERYLEAAWGAYEFMRSPVADGGTLASFDDGQPVLQGYPNSTVAEHVLSGALIGTFGVYDLARVTGEQDVMDEFDELAAALATNLSLYDFEGWSRFSLGIARGPSSHVFHRLYIAELRVLAELTGDRAFGRQADHWERSLIEWTESLESESD